MNAERISELRQSLTDENISYGELFEIQETAHLLAFDDEGMMADETLDVIESLLY